MTPEEKIKKFEEIQRLFWDLAINGNLLQSTTFAAVIRHLQIEGPNGESPEDA